MGQGLAGSIWENYRGPFQGLKANNHDWAWRGGRSAWGGSKILSLKDNHWHAASLKRGNETMGQKRRHENRLVKKGEEAERRIK